MNNTAKVAVVALVLALTGCAPATPAAPVDPAAVEALADEISLALGGDAAQKEAARYLGRAAMLYPYEQCMAKAGYTVANPYLPQWAGWTPNSTEGHWMGKLQYKVSPAMLGSAALEASAYEPAKKGTEQDTPGYHKASNECQGTVELDLGDQPGVPVGAYDTYGEFDKLIWAVEGELGSIEPYAACMAEAGHDYRQEVSDHEGWEGMYMALSGGAPAAPLPGQEPSPEWLDFLALEQDTLNADERCRADQYHRGLVLLAPALEEFRTTHAAEITRIARDWDDTLALAREYGFQG